MNISQLVHDAKQGNPAAQQQLFGQLCDRMQLLCRRYVKVEQDAEELVLDGFYKFFKSLQEFEYRNEAALYSWLKKIMINECLMFLRKKHAFMIVSETAAEDIPFEEDVLDQLSAAEIFQAVIQLPVGYRTVFNLYEIEGMNHGEIAALLGVSEGTSKSQLSKAKALLQKTLTKKNITYVKRGTQG
jgi:RNA polymerase sigma factor (sigma-70 family)